MVIEIDPKQPEKRNAAIAAIEDRKKRKKPNPPDLPIPLPDRSGQAKRKPEIPREGPPPDNSQIAAMACKIASMVKDKRRKSMVPQIIDRGPPLPLPPPPLLPPPFEPPSRSRAVVFKGKGRRLVDNDEPVAYPKIPIKTQNLKRKTGGMSGRARTQRFDQLALVPVA